MSTILILTDNDSLKQELKRALPKAYTLTTKLPADLVIIDVDTHSLDAIAGKSVPIIAMGSGTDIKETLHGGAHDYLLKQDIDPLHLENVLITTLEHYASIESLRALSFTDPLTELYNRRGFFTLFEQQLSIAKRLNQGFYLFLLDLDELKQINDAHGHAAGDQALISLAHCVKTVFRHHDILSRIGGDEFAVIAINAAEGSGEQLKTAIANHLPQDLSVSVGYVYVTAKEKRSIEALLEIADQALYAHKRSSNRAT